MLLALAASLRWKYFFCFITESMICLFGFLNASLKAHVEEHLFSPTTFQRNIWMDSSSPNLRHYLIAGGSQAANATKRFCRVPSYGTAGSGKPVVRGDRARPRLISLEIFTGQVWQNSSQQLSVIQAHERDFHPIEGSKMLKGGGGCLVDG